MNNRTQVMLGTILGIILGALFCIFYDPSPAATAKAAPEFARTFEVVDRQGGVVYTIREVRP